MKKGIWILLALFLIVVFVILIVVIKSNKNDKKGENMINVTSSAFANGEEIPKRYTCDGEDINPPLEISNVPDGTKSLVLIVDDPDAPAGTWTHWVLFNISPQATTITENSTPAGAIFGMTSFKEAKYGGPCPPSGSHRYYFKVFALKDIVNLPEGALREQLEAAMKDLILDQGEVIGHYQRSR